DGALRNWASPDPYSSKNFPWKSKANLKHKSNLVDYGFNHLNLKAPAPQEQVPLYVADLSSIQDTDDIRTYLDVLQEKFKLMCLFILKENELGLDPNRHMDKDLTAVELAKPPIVFNFATQELVRDLINIRIKLIDLMADETSATENDDEIQEIGHHYLWAWKEFLDILASLLLSRDDETKRMQAHKMMTTQL
ncbi:hypothetical protein GQ44DRAFT_573600, partial [Phaeosphaeriaceae sp. PMI808]